MVQNIGLDMPVVCWTVLMAAFMPLETAVGNTFSSGPPPPGNCCEKFRGKSTGVDIGVVAAPGPALRLLKVLSGFPIP